MTNEEAKELYFKAVGHFDRGEHEQALAFFDELDQHRPNSRHVNHYRAQCLIALDQLEAAEALCSKLEGKLEADQWTALQQKLSKARTALADTHRVEAEAQQQAAMQQQNTPANGNIFEIESVYPVSTDQAAVTGHVKSGVFHQGDTLTLVTAAGMPLMAPIDRIGPAETPLNLVRAGQRTVFLLRVEPNLVAPGTRAFSEVQQESYAETMVVSTDSPSPQTVGITADLLDVEKQVKRGEYAEAEKVLTTYVEQHPENGVAHRLLARIYLEGDAPLRNVDRALQHIRKAYELGGADDPAVIDILAEALAAHGEAEQGLRFLERLYGVTQTPEARTALAKRIYAYRDANDLGHVWEFSDNCADILFTATNSAEVLTALQRGTVALEAHCRKDRIGEWRPIETLLVPEHPEIAALFTTAKTKKGSGQNLIWLLLIALLTAAIVAALLLFHIE